MKRKNISIKKLKRIINWEIAHANSNSSGDSPKDVELMQDGMKVIFFDLDCYQKGQEKLIKLGTE